jgi:hypothetical protein
MEGIHRRHKLNHKKKYLVIVTYNKLRRRVLAKNCHNVSCDAFNLLDEFSFLENVTQKRESF